MVEYRDITEFPGYRVGDDGSVWSCWMQVMLGRPRGCRWELSDAWRRRKPVLNRIGGYLLVSLQRAGKQYVRSVHRLVAIAFIGPCPVGHEVCHNDGDPTNNALSNLRYGTRKKNAADCARHGTQTRMRGERNGSSILTEDQVIEIRRLGVAGMSQSERGRRFGVNQSTICNIDRRKLWSHLP